MCVAENAITGSRIFNQWIHVVRFALFSFFFFFSIHLLQAFQVNNKNINETITPYAYNNLLCVVLKKNQEDRFFCFFFVVEFIWSDISSGCCWCFFPIAYWCFNLLTYLESTTILIQTKERKCVPENGMLDFPIQMPLFCGFCIPKWWSPLEINVVIKVFDRN